MSEQLGVSGVVLALVVLTVLAVGSWLVPVVAAAFTLEGLQ